MREVLIIHGLGGSDKPHWQAWLADKLMHSPTCNVHFPQLPNRDHPKLEAWCEVVWGILEEGVIDTVVAHSLGCYLWAHLVARHPELRLNKLLLVAPPRPNLAWPALADFWPAPEVTLRDSSDEGLVVLSDNDELCRVKEGRALAEGWGLPTVVLPKAGHINVASGYGPWPWVLEWVLR
ncbi:MAG: alpha/beta hydrolase [Campylobacterales bacterium]